MCEEFDAWSVKGDCESCDVSFVTSFTIVLSKAVLQDTVSDSCSAHWASNM